MFLLINHQNQSPKKCESLLTHRYHKGNGDNGAQGDVSQAINVFGFNTCGNSTLCISDLLDKVGMRDCIFSHCPGHVVPQAFFDGKYNTIDGDGGMRLR